MSDGDDGNSFRDLVLIECSRMFVTYTFVICSIKLLTYLLNVNANANDLI